VTFVPDPTAERLPTTAIEVYQTRGGVPVHVKREDTCWPWPPLSKARGVWGAIQSRPGQNVAVVDTGRSVNGLLVTTIARTLGRQVRVGFPRYVKDQPEAVTNTAAFAVRLGADLVPIPANRQFVMRAAMARLLEPGWFLFPTGLRLPETVSAVAAEAAGVPAGYRSVVVPTGTGTHLAGLLRTFPGDVVAVQGYARPADRFRADVRRMSGVQRQYTLITSFLDYFEARPDRLPPFPANMYYEVKAWAWLNRPGIAEGLPQPILFWNIGA